MINLNVQIMTLIASFLYGVFFSILVNINYKYLYQKNIILRIIFTFLFVIVNVLLYFIIIKKINNAILHPYSFGMILVGFCLHYHTHKLVVNHKKKWYTRFMIEGDKMTTKKKIPRASKNRLIIFGTISIFLMGNLVVNFINYMININQLKETQRKLTSELLSLKEDAEDLSTTIQKLKDPDYIARYAREKYDYSTDGEYIIKIEEKEENDSLEVNENKKYPIYIYGSVIVLVGIFIYIVKRK